LKQLAVDYMHPEVPVTTNGVSSNNFFRRVNAPDEVDQEARAEILADAAALKQLAVDYMHPEVPVTTNGVPSKNFFDDSECTNDSTVNDILSDCEQLSELAKNYLHPELPVISNGNMGRCYFERASKEVRYLEEIKGVIDDDLTEEEERVAILADAAALKRLACDYLHPEVTLQSTAGNVSRCFFGKSDESEDEEERAAILADAAKLKELASAYSKNAPRIVSSAAGSNYFNRHGAPIEDLPGLESASSSAVSSPTRGERRQDRALSDQFDMDLDFGSTLGKSGLLYNNVDFNVDAIDTLQKVDDEEDTEECGEKEENGGKMSRSPSSILLFEQGQLAAESEA